MEIEMAYTLRNGSKYTIREATQADAAQMLDYIAHIAGESDNLTFGPGEFKMSLEDEARYIEQSREGHNQLFIVALVDGQIVGNLNFTGGHRPRIAHDGEFGVSVLKSHWSNGIAKELITYMINWAKTGETIKKINLKVRDDNDNAIQLYKKLGFEVEGHISRQFFIEGKYYSVYHMGLEL